MNSLLYSDGIYVGDESRFNSRFNDNKSLNGTAMAPKGVDYSRAQREMTAQGFERYNIDDDDGIYIAKMPERAFFNDGEPVIVKAQPGVFVGSHWQPKEHTEVQQRAAPRKSADPKDLFSNILRGSNNIEVRTHVGTYDKGRVVEQQPLTDFVSTMNNRINEVIAPRAMPSTSLTSTAEEKPKTTKKFTFVNGKLVQVEAKEDTVPKKPISDSTIGI